MAAQAQPSPSCSSYISQQLRSEGLSPSSGHARQETVSVRSSQRMTEATPSEIPTRILNVREKIISAAGAAFISALIVNPLDVAKTRLQAQAARLTSPQMTAGAAEPHAAEKVKGKDGMLQALTEMGAVAPVHNALGTPEYKSTWDVFYKVVRQEGFFRLWRGTNASLAISMPTVGIYLPTYDVLHESLERFSDSNSLHLKPYTPLLAASGARSLVCLICSPLELVRTRMQAHEEVRGGKAPGMWGTLRGVLSTVREAPGGRLQGVQLLWTGVGAQLARDVPFSAMCWATLEPVRGYLLEAAGPNPHAANVFGANFAAGVLSGSIAAAITCPLDVVKTWRQIEKDPVKAVTMTNRQTLYEIWRKGGVRGLFMGVGPRMGRNGPSIGIVVSLYELVKHFVNRASTS